MEINIQEAQKRLEEKRELLKQTEPEQISSVETKDIVCIDCAETFTSKIFMGMGPERCPDCGQKNEDIFEEQMRIKEEKVKEQVRELRYNGRIANLGIGDRFLGMVFEDYLPTCDKAKKILNECRSYVENFSDKYRSNILMIGSPGTGKNMLAAIIAQGILKKDMSCLHTTAMKLVRRVKESWRDKEESEQEVINSFIYPHLLIIDEIGVQFGSATEQLYLTEIINERYERRRPTILISNLKLSQLTEVMGERVIDRFYDDGSKFLVFDWPSYRRKDK